MWVTDPDFALVHHVQEIGAPGDGSFRTLLDWAGNWAARRLDPGRPLWELTTVRGVLDAGPGINAEGPFVAVLMKASHAVMDGMSASKMTEAFAGVDPEALLAGNVDLGDLFVGEPSPPMTGPKLFAEGWASEGRALVRSTRKVAKGAVRLARDPQQAKAGVATTKAQIAHFRNVMTADAPKSPLFAERSHAIRIDQVVVPFEPFKLGAKAGSGTINDGFLAAVAHAMHVYHEKFGVDIGTLRTSVAVSTRGGAGADVIGNQVSALTVDLAVDGRDAEALLADCGAQAKEQLGPRVFEVVDSVAPLMCRVPRRLLKSLLLNRPPIADIITSNVRMAADTDAMFGRPSVVTIPIPPRAGAAINITMISRGADIIVGVNSDPAAITDPDAFVEALRAGFQAVSDLAG